MIVTRDVYSLTSSSLPVGASLSSILSSYVSKAGAVSEAGLDLMRFNVKTFFIANKGANPLNAGRLEATNIPAEHRQANDWETIDSTTFAFLAAGSAKSKVVADDGRRYWRVQASSTNGTICVANVTAR